MIRALFVFCVMVTLVKATKRTDVEQCVYNEGSLPTRTYIEGCTTPPCQIADEDMVINLKFRTPRSIESLKTKATLYLDIGLTAIPIPLNLGEYAETCDFLTKRSCPAKSGKNLKATFPVPIETSFFPTGVTRVLELQLVDEEEEAVTCVRTRVTKAA